MIKIAGSAFLGAVFGAAIAYAATGPVQTAGYRHADDVKQVSIDPAEMTKRAKDLPILKIDSLF